MGNTAASHITSPGPPVWAWARRPRVHMLIDTVHIFVYGYCTNNQCKVLQGAPYVEKPDWSFVSQCPLTLLYQNPQHISNDTGTYLQKHSTLEQIITKYALTIKQPKVCHFSLVLRKACYMIPILSRLLAQGGLCFERLRQGPV